jgi:hypothetical protein
MSDEQTLEPKQTFVPPADRPEVKLTPITPLSDLRVRDLDEILGKNQPTAHNQAENSGIIHGHIHKPSADICDLAAISVSKDQPALQRVIDALLALEKRLDVAALPPAPPVFCENWSGARLTKKGGLPGRPDIPPNGAFRSVWATWTVPSVKPPTPSGQGNWNSASWVGLGGGASTRNFDGMNADERWSVDVLQAGFDHNVTRDDKGNLTWTYQAWYAWDPGLDSTSASYMVTVPVPVAPGDDVFVKVEHVMNTDQGWIEFFNYTQNVSKCVQINKPKEIDRFRGDTIEWVLERPSAGNSYYSLADYGSVDFINAAGETYGGTIIVAEQGELIAMPNSSAAINPPHRLTVTYKS